MLAGNQPVTVEDRNVRIGRADDHVGAVDHRCGGVSGADVRCLKPRSFPTANFSRFSRVGLKTRTLSIDFRIQVSARRCSLA